VFAPRIFALAFNGRGLDFLAVYRDLHGAPFVCERTT
jgi:hypothetical protein